MNLAFLFASCDTMPIVQSEIPWGSSIVDQNCVRKAVSATAGIKFERQEVKSMDDSICPIDPCLKKIYATFYTVLENKKYKSAYVKFYENTNGKIYEVRNYGSGAINTPLPEEEKAGFKSALASLNIQIQKFCPDAGMASEPR